MSGQTIDFSDLLAELIAVARKEFGEPEYSYHKIMHQWECGSRRRRTRGRHWTSVSSPNPECTMEEYEANHAKGKHDEVEAFMGRLPQTFYTWERKLKTAGWPQRLAAMIEDAANRVICDSDNNQHSASPCGTR